MKKETRFFVIMTYIVFWVLFAITGVIQTFVTQNTIVITTLSHLCAWASCFVLLIWSKKFAPDMTRKKFFKSFFQEKLQIRVCLALVLLSTSIFATSLFCAALVQNLPVKSLLSTPSVSILGAALIELVNGPIGEEFGWRGYFLTTKAKSLGILKASLLNGVLWGFWHTPLWFIKGFSGKKLIIYIIAFLVSIISSNIVIGYVYLKKKNLIYSIILHFLNNFLFGVIYKGDFITIMVFNAIFNLFAAMLFILINRKRNVAE